MKLALQQVTVTITLRPGELVSARGPITEAWAVMRGVELGGVGTPEGDATPAPFTAVAYEASQHDARLAVAYALEALARQLRGAS